MGIHLVIGLKHPCTMTKILLLHGPNLNMLGGREPEHYGSATLASINSDCQRLADENSVELEVMQSNAEHELVDRIQHAIEIDFIIINPAAFTHTSVAIRDALAAVAVPFIEIHLSNVHAREPFRHKSLLSDMAKGVISGLGPIGYILALRAAIDITMTSKG
ncbi:MAG: type II 3-dehydroquinate dehydratase [Gammaproteobacteria bacterium]|nr:MAG: type II 3-dehydroquinate dehydratase [Gammaproteobacteria bacterium]